jgi:hypothetical protein
VLADSKWLSFFFLHALHDRHWKKKETKKFKANPIAPRVLPGQRLPIA